MDSLSVHAYLEGKTILDVGSGAGLPGIPLAILYPKKFFTLLDSNGKKTRFMRQAVIDLKLDNVQIIQERVEAFHGEFDHVISRAFSSLKNFLDSSERLVKPGGTLLAMKGDKLEQLNKKRISVYPISVPELNSPRHLYVIEKPARSN
jgi:16S rRNA (guanine527-N7)-methyltransferase